MKRIILIVTLAMLVCSCATYKREVRAIEVEAAREITDTALFLLCGSPLATVQEKLASDSRIAGWYIMCNYEIPSFKITKE